MMKRGEKINKNFPPTLILCLYIYMGSRNSLVAELGILGNKKPPPNFFDEGCRNDSI